MASPFQYFPMTLHTPAALSFGVGLFLGIIGATLGIGPIAILFIALIYFWKERSRARLLVSIPIFQYLVVQFALTWWHTGQMFAIEMQHYYVLMFFAVPVIHFFATDFEFDQKSLILGLVSGLAISTTLLAVDVFSAWNNNSCRARAFQTNPLRTTLHMVPIASLIIALEAQKGRFRVLSAGLVFLMLFTTGNLTGSRMTFYSVFVVLALMLIFFIKYKNFLAVKRLVFTVLLGLIFVVAFDIASGCNFLKRINLNVTNSFSILTGKASDPAVAVPAVPNPAAIAKANEAKKERPAVKGNGEEAEKNQAKDQTKEKAKAKAKAKAKSKKKPKKPKPKKEKTTSEGIRLALWKNAVDSIRAHPFLGEGAVRELEIARMSEGKAPRGGATHNQYLSWAIGGGVVSLISAFVLMATHLLTTQNRFAAAAFVIPWLISSLTISTLSLVGTMAEFVVTLVVLMPLLGIKKTGWIFSRPR